MRAGEGFDGEHYQFFSQLADVANRLGDYEVFDVAKQKKWNVKKAKVQARRTQIERQTKYALLISWLAGGLWCLASRAEQMDALKMHWPKMPPYSLEAITMAQKRLGLQWAET
jgi:hypothetical protein